MLFFSNAPSCHHSCTITMSYRRRENMENVSKKWSQLLLPFYYSQQLAVDILAGSFFLLISAQSLTGVFCCKLEARCLFPFLDLPQSTPDQFPHSRGLQQGLNLGRLSLKSSLKSEIQNPNYYKYLLLAQNHGSNLTFYQARYFQKATLDIVKTEVMATVVCLLLAKNLLLHVIQKSKTIVANQLPVRLTSKITIT